MYNKLSLKVVGLSLGVLLAVSYALCVVVALIFPRYAMYAIWAPLLPGFEWISAFSFALGLVESFLYGIYIAAVFVPVYNYLIDRGIAKDGTAVTGG